MAIPARGLGSLTEADTLPDAHRPKFHGTDWENLEGVGWRLQARCRGTDPSAWVPNTEVEPVPDWVRALCDRCPSRSACLATAVASQSRGYWAATTTRMRRQLATG